MALTFAPSLVQTSIYAGIGVGFATMLILMGAATANVTPAEEHISPGVYSEDREDLIAPTDKSQGMFAFCMRGMVSCIKCNSAIFRFA